MTLNKWDLMPQVKNGFQAVSDRIHFLFGQMEYAPIIPVSAETGSGMEELLNTAIRIYNQLNLKIDTAPLNQALERWLEEYPPPIGPQTRFKVKYAVQVSENPVKFVIFCSRPQAVTEPYVAYLRNRIRRDLGFSLVPLSIEIRDSPRPAGRAASDKRVRRRRS
jgi:GTP-binding protein